MCGGIGFFCCNGPRRCTDCYKKRCHARFGGIDCCGARCHSRCHRSICSNRCHVHRSEVACSVRHHHSFGVTIHPPRGRRRHPTAPPRAHPGEPRVRPSEPSNSRHHPSIPRTEPSEPGGSRGGGRSKHPSQHKRGSRISGSHRRGEHVAPSNESIEEKGNGGRGSSSHSKKDGGDGSGREATIHVHAM